MDSPTAGQRFIRLVNGAIYEVLAKLEFEDGEFWCECPDIDCDERVTVDAAGVRDAPEAPRRSPVADPRRDVRTSH